MDDVVAYLEGGRERFLAELGDFLRIPSISSASGHRDDVRRCAEFAAEHLRRIGFSRAEVLPTTPDGHPVVYGEWLGAPGAPTALVYGHYDVQPVDPLDLWETPPFEPRMATLPDGRKVISARGACDDKGQVMTFLEACRAFKAIAGELPVGITVMVEGEEESGSPNLPAFVEANRDALEADLALVCDTGMWDRNT